MTLSPLHEALVALCRSSPDFVADLIAGQTREHLPAYTETKEASAQLTEAVPVQYAADAVLLFTRGQRTLFAVVVEVQREPDHRKRWRWPQYLASAGAEHRCPVVLLVICPKGSTAQWARELPARCAADADGLPVLTWMPIVIGPDDVPAIEDPVLAAADPELAMLSIITHGQQDPVPFAAALTAALLHIDKTDRDRARTYNDLVVAALPAPAAHLLEETMSTITPSFTERIIAEGEARGLAEGEARGLAEGEARGLAEGEARGQAHSLLTILATRGFCVPPEIRDRITTCTDLGQLEAWIARSITIEHIDDLFR